MYPYYGSYRPSPPVGPTPGMPMPIIRPNYGVPPLPPYGSNAADYPPQPPVGPPIVPSQMAYSFKPPTFDSYLCESFFSRSTTEAEDTAITQLLLARHNEIMPTSAEQSAISALMSKVKQSLEKIAVSPDAFQAVGIEEVREVGSIKKGTMITKHNTADLVVVLKTLPIVESINSLGQKIVHDLKSEHPSEIFGCVTRDFGCEIAGTHAVIRVLIAILPQNINQLDKDLHLPEKALIRNMAALHHAKWFEENASHSVIKALIRLLKYLKKKHVGLQALTVWQIELLSHYSVMNTPTRIPLPLALAFRRFFQILATGMLLPSSPAFIDPCDTKSRIHYNLSFEEMDTICSTSQTILRIIIHGGTDQLFAGEGISTVTTEMSIWENSVVVTPLEKAYIKEEMEPYYVKCQENGNLEMAKAEEKKT